MAFSITDLFADLVRFNMDCTRLSDVLSRLLTDVNSFFFFSSSNSFCLSFSSFLAKNLLTMFNTQQVSFDSFFAGSTDALKYVTLRNNTNICIWYIRVEIWSNTFNVRLSKSIVTRVLFFYQTNHVSNRIIIWRYLLFSLWSCRFSELDRVNYKNCPLSLSVYIPEALCRNFTIIYARW